MRIGSMSLPPIDNELSHTHSPQGVFLKYSALYSHPEARRLVPICVKEHTTALVTSPSQVASGFLVSSAAGLDFLLLRLVTPDIPFFRLFFFFHCPASA